MVGAWASCLISASFKTPGGCESQHLSGQHSVSLGHSGGSRFAQVCRPLPEDQPVWSWWAALATGQYMQDAMCNMSCWWHFGVFRCAGIQVYRFAHESPSTRLLFCVYLCTHVEARGQAGPLALSPT